MRDLRLNPPTTGRPGWAEREREPKPYDFVKIPSRVKRDPTIGHDAALRTGLLSGRLTLQIRADSHLFVAGPAPSLSEDIDGSAGGVARGCYKVGQRAAVPGSSLKGAIRAVFEAATASCVGVTRVDPTRLPHPQRQKCLPSIACPACSVFGTQGLMARVSFHDALMGKEQKTAIHRLPALYRPRPTSPTYFRDDGNVKGRKFYLHGRLASGTEPAEVIPGGSVLVGQVDFSNLTRSELGALLFACGADGRIRLKLGGGKPACLGTITISAVQLALLDVATFLGPDRKESRLVGTGLQSTIVSFVDEARASGYLDAISEAALRGLLGDLGERTCPREMY